MSRDTVTYIELAAGGRQDAPAGKQATTHSDACRGHDPENRGRMAQVFEDYNEQDFHREYTDAFVLGVWAVAFLVAGAAFVAAPYVLQILFSLFDWLAN